MKGTSPRVPLGYIRVSTTKQDESGLSLEEQKRRIEAWTVAQDLKLEQVYEDGAESAKNLDRPQVQEVLRRVRDGEVSHVIVYKLDRITRSVKDLYELITVFQKHDVAFCSVTESLDTSSAIGRAMVGLIGVFAQWERETIAERTIMALTAKRHRGERLGGHRPFGWTTKGKKLVPNEEEQVVLKAILKGVADGKGYSEIAAILNRKGIRPASGKQWYASSVRSVALRAKKAHSPTGE
jgi:site-specific DNA recombinase